MKKYAVKLKDDDRHLILSLPFLYELKRYDPEGKIYLLIQPGQEHFFDFIDLELNFIPLKFKADKSIGSFFSIHKFAANSIELDRVEIFYSFESGFVNKFIGKSLKANRTFLIEEDSKDFLKSTLYMIRDSLKCELSPSLIRTKKFPPLFGDWRERPYIVLDYGKKENSLEYWEELLLNFDPIKVVILYDESDEKRVKSEKESWEKQHEYIFKRNPQTRDRVQLYSYSQVVISDDPELIELAALCGARIAQFKEMHSIPDYFSQEHFVFDRTKESMDQFALFLK